MESIKNIIQSKDLFLIAGPCVIENADLTFEIAEKLKEITSQLNIPFVFKISLLLLIIFSIILNPSIPP